MSKPEPRPFTLSVPDGDIADLKERLARTRWPDEPPLAPWSTGASLDYVKDLADYWRTRFDWRPWEAKLNGFRQFTVPIRGIALHFIHEPGRGPNPMPLLISHGWPGSVLEFHDLIHRLTDRFTVIAPSLPGYTLSFKPGQPRFGAEEIADTFVELMTDVLGYEKFAFQGGDWGASIGSIIGHRYPERLIGLHLNLLAVRRDPALIANPSPEEKKFLDELNEFLKEESGYQWIQGTRPQTLAFGLTDSPSGLAAWVAEKFHRWTDNDGRPEDAVSRDVMLANISLYWFTGAIGSSFWPYYSRMHRPWFLPLGETIKVPTGYAGFPREILRPPRSLAAKTYVDIRRWTDLPKGGHFAALEQSEVLAREMHAFFGGLAE